jgi:hypothetical protein
MMEKRHVGGGCTLLHLLGTAAAMAFLLPRSAGAANDAKVISGTLSSPLLGCLLSLGQLFCSCPTLQTIWIWQWHAHAHPVAGAGLSPLSAPPPTAGADDDLLPPPSRAPVQKAAPHFGFPLQPGDASAAAPSGSERYPFIGSNPTVPLPTGMTDTSTVLPLPDTGTGDATTKVLL